MESFWIMTLFCVLTIMFPLALGEMLSEKQSSLGEWRSFKGNHRQIAKLTDYEVVEPKMLSGRRRREVFTMTEDGHIPEVSFVVPIEGEEYILDMWINKNLFPSHFVESTYLPGGKKIHRKPHESHHCYYHGGVRGVEDSNVALSTCDGLSGVIFLNGTSFYIEPLQYSRAEHLVYNAANVNRPKHKYDYGVHEDPQYSIPEQSTDHIRRSKRDVHTEIKYIELLIANDYTEFVDIGSVEECLSRSKEMANIMDAIYKQLNTRVALVGVEVWNEGDPFTVSTNPTTAMQEFHKWRKDELLKQSVVYNDNAQLVTGKAFDGATVGMASLAAMCSYQRSGGVNEDHGDHAADVASTMSHEMGHNMGFIHDTDDRKCECSADPYIGCIMEPSSGSTPPTVFSSCSLADLSSSLERGLGACLFDYPSDIFGGPVCGNGFLDEGEECDCGPVETCDNECCVPETCTLNVNATCAEGECCDNCQLKAAATLCRDRVNTCDLPEYCTGRSSACPSNVYIQNGQSCPNKESSDSVCFDGQCVTYTQQCKKMWGKSSKGAVVECYDYNTRGNTFGNCGPTGKKDEHGDPTFLKCDREHDMCGKLMCTGGGDYPIAGTVRSASRGVVYANGKEMTCDSASIDLGQDVPDPGYVANGSPCGHGKVCMDFKCINTTELNIRQCPYKCHGNGVCNSKNNCHCNNDWAPPLCNTPGNGGSVDSGPATPPQRYRGSTGTIVALVILFLVVLPLVGIAAIVAYLKRDQLKTILCKQRQKQFHNHPEASTGMNNRNHRPQQVARQPSISKHQIQHPHHNNRIEFHDITKVPEKPSTGRAPQQGLRKPPSPPSDALRPVRPPPPVPVGNGSVASKPSANRPSILQQNSRPYNSVSARPSVTRPSVLPSGNNSVAARPAVSRPSVLPTIHSPERLAASKPPPPFLRPTAVVNPNNKTVALKPVGMARKASPENTEEEFKPLLKPTNVKPGGSVSSRPKISRPTLVSATTSDDAPVKPPPFITNASKTVAARPAPQRPSVLTSNINTKSGGSLSSKLPPQRPSILPSNSGGVNTKPLRPSGLASKANEGAAAKPTVTLRTNPSSNKPAVPKPSTAASTRDSVALKPPKQALKPPGRPNLAPKPNANNCAENRPVSFVASSRPKAGERKPKVAPRPVSVEVKMKPQVKPRKTGNNAEIL